MAKICRTKQHCLCATRPRYFSFVDRERKSCDRLLLCARCLTSQPKPYLLDVFDTEKEAFPQRRGPRRRLTAAPGNYAGYDHAANSSHPRRAKRSHTAQYNYPNRRVNCSTKSNDDMTIILVEQYFDFAFQLAEQFYTLKRGAITISGNKSDITQAEVLFHVTV